MRIKLLVIIVLSLLGVLPVAAQRITLRSFEQDIYDISGSYESRRDVNGDLCALIRVQLPVEGCLFEGDIVGNVEYMVNEYWVYMVNNAKRLTVKCPGLETAVIVWEERVGNYVAAAAHSSVYGDDLYVVDVDGDLVFDIIIDDEGYVLDYVHDYLSVSDAELMIDSDPGYLAANDTDNTSLPVGEDISNDIISA